MQELHEEHEQWLNNSRALVDSPDFQLVTECQLPKKLALTSDSIVDMFGDNARVVTIDASKDIAAVFNEIDSILQVLLKNQFE